MMASRFVFVGNRRFVLDEMIAHECDLSLVIIAEGTHLERDFHSGALPASLDVRVVDSKRALVEVLQAADPFDVLVSNGCPFVLPISELPQARYVNIHPSFLPDLRGVDPVIGAILFSRDAGATCHVMDAGVDTGDIISQVRIPYSDDLDVTTLYQLSFVAEREVFTAALKRDFERLGPQCGNEGDMYYSRRPEDQVITFTEPVELIFRKIRAFNNRSIGCRFFIGEKPYRVFSAERMTNPFLVRHVQSFDQGVVVLSFEACIIFRIEKDVIRFKEIQSDDGLPIPCGQKLF